MPELILARIQMAMFFAFHILFAVAGMGMPVLMVLAEWAFLRTRKPVYAELARRWARGTAVLFAVGAVSGTVLSFELGLLWPRFMEFSGGVIGLPFALEGFAFFTEAIFLGIYLYGWEKVSPRLHLAAGVMVALGGVLSGVFVVSANGWMNSPAGFVLEGGRPVDISPLSAMANPAWGNMAIHMTLAAFAATGFAVAGIHAFQLLRDAGNRFHRAALVIALSVGGAAAVLQPLSGDLSARFVARNQPVKLAAMEGQWRTQRGAPLRIGGFPDPVSETTPYAIEIPRGLSLLAFHDPDAEVLGLSAVPRDERPDPRPVHAAFQVMLACGLCMAAVAVAGALLGWRRREAVFGRPFLLAVSACGPLGLLAVEAGWVVTEMGRQPWIIYKVMRTSEAVTPVGGLFLPFALFSLIYLALGIFAVRMLRRELAESPSFPGGGGPTG
ncbi:MAG TPA: cytochrome ubiquinol oxidase subunit I [Deltaproteobacteria bacterium]|nr:MAG: cytochrome BD ubiquinol oxidase subunit I [Deltaproteobacteria bacterium GWC2_65_14]HBO70574.1 cytochrome ubiquinol oxidase subunit I [Deltaproteobacteria bacterium]